MENGVYDNIASEARLGPLMSSLERSRIPLRYMASLLSGGNEEIIRDVYRKMVAVRVYMRSKKVKDIPAEEVEKALQLGKTTPAEVEAIWRLTSMPTFEERFVGVPPMERETAVDSLFPSARSGRATIRFPQGRGWRWLPYRSGSRTVTALHYAGRETAVGFRCSMLESCLAQLPSS